jgi:hypothetical protein
MGQEEDTPGTSEALQRRLAELKVLYDDHLISPEVYRARQLEIEGISALRGSLSAPRSSEPAIHSFVGPSTTPLENTPIKTRLSLLGGRLNFYWPHWYAIGWISWLVGLLVWLAVMVVLTSLVVNALRAAVAAGHLPFFAVGQSAVGIIAIGQFAMLITIGQLTMGVVNISQCGIGLLFSVAMATASFGWTLAIAHISGFNIRSMIGMSLFKSCGAFISFNLLGPFFFRNTPLVSLLGSKTEHEIRDRKLAWR